jgi:hypothetical protein
MKNGELFIYIPLNQLPEQKNDLILEIWGNGKLRAKEKVNVIAPPKNNR